MFTIKIPRSFPVGTPIFTLSLLSSPEYHYANARTRDSSSGNRYGGGFDSRPLPPPPSGLRHSNSNYRREETLAELRLPPESDDGGGAGEILENSPKATYILNDIEAKDLDTTASLAFDIDWDSSCAFKNGVQIDKEKVRKWFDIQLSDVSGVTSSAVLMVGEVSPDREVADLVTLSIRVIDINTEEGLPDRDQKTLDVTINDENDCDPTFFGDYSNLNVTENSAGGFVFGSLLTKDEDEADRMRFSINDDSIVHVVQGQNFEAYLVVSDGAVIDREMTDTILVTITVTDSANHYTSQEFTIRVIDVNDNAPIFSDDVILATFTSGSTIGTNLKTFSANDIDLNEVLTYNTLNDFEWHNCETEPTADIPFTVRKNEDGDAELILNFEPDGIDSGYCSFTITATDNDGVHVTSIQGKVYAITVDYQHDVQSQTVGDIMPGLNANRTAE